MPELIDYSYARFTPAEIRAAGKAGVIRYVASGRPQVSATRAEVDGFRAAGLVFVAVWQNGDSRPLGGRAAGDTDARDAAAYCAGLGAGFIDPVYFAVDFDATPAQLPAVAAYFDGVASVLGWARVGAYGGLPVLTYLRAHTPLGLFWQTVAWSAGTVAPFAQLHQYRINDTLLGRAVDLDRSLADHYGQWGVPMPTTYPGAVWRPLGAQTQPRMRAHEVVCLHTMVGYLASTDAYFRQQGFGGTESHFGVGGSWGSDASQGLDGAVWQWQDLDYTADANLEGNDRVISIETADNAPQSPADIAAWTPAQCDAIVELVAWLCRRYDIPPVIVADTRPGTKGIGWHAQGTAASLPAGAERWSTTVGKPCPTARRIDQIRSIIVPRVQARMRGEEEDVFMAALSDAEQAELLAAARQINGAIGAGQSTFAGTLKATLGTVQTLVNLTRSNAGALGAAIGNAESAVLAAVATLPTEGLSDSDRQKLATAILEMLNEQGIEIDGDAMVDALAARLVPAAAPAHG